MGRGWATGCRGRAVLSSQGVADMYNMCTLFRVCSTCSLPQNGAAVQLHAHPPVHALAPVGRLLDAVGAGAQGHLQVSYSGSKQSKEGLLVRRSPEPTAGFKPSTQQLLLRRAKQAPAVGLRSAYHARSMCFKRVRQARHLPAGQQSGNQPANCPVEPRLFAPRAPQWARGPPAAQSGRSAPGRARSPESPAGGEGIRGDQRGDRLGALMGMRGARWSRTTPLGRLLSQASNWQAAFQARKRAQCCPPGRRGRSPQRSSAPRATWGQRVRGDRYWVKTRGALLFVMSVRHYVTTRGAGVMPPTWASESAPAQQQQQRQRQRQQQPSCAAVPATSSTGVAAALQRRNRTSAHLAKRAPCL